MKHGHTKELNFYTKRESALTYLREAKDIYVIYLEVKT